MLLSTPFDFESHHVFINGEWKAPASGQSMALINPSTGATLCDIAVADATDVNDAVAAARQAANGAWGKTSAVERGRLLTRLGNRVLDHIDSLAELEAMDVGKPLTQARNDVIALARYCEFFGGAADKVHGETIPYLDGYTVYTLREPHGVTAHIVPWNYPMQIIGRSIGAALAMGNATVLKPAEEACLTALAFTELARQVGFPAGALNVVPGIGAVAGAALSAHPDVNHVSFTGSVASGRAVQQSAAEHVAPVTLELGGKSAQVVFDDVDMDTAIPFLLNAGIQNAGQTCSAASRLLVHRSRHVEMVEKLATAYTALRVGPAIDDYELGPMISRRQQSLVQSFLEKGADLSMAAQGKLVSDVPEQGAYVLPTLFDEVSPNHILAQQEIFGPVQCVIVFDDDEEAIRIANGTRYGLVAAAWTSDGARQMRMAKALRAGQVFINNYGAGGGVELPFGGVGDSGHGREKGLESLFGFSTLKTVAVKHG